MFDISAIPATITLTTIQACVVALDMLLLFGPNLPGEDAEHLRYDVYVEQPSLKDAISAHIPKALAAAGEDALRYKRDVIAAASRATLVGALNANEFGPLVMLQLHAHEDKRIDELVKHFHKDIREANDDTGMPEASILLKVLLEVSLLVNESCL